MASQHTEALKKKSPRKNLRYSTSFDIVTDGRHSYCVSYLETGKEDF